MNSGKIRHIVLSGGGGTGFAYYGALRESHKDGFWNIDNIQSVHGVSSGAIFIILISLLKHITWNDYDDFFIKRPWENVFNMTPDKIMNSYSNLGICDRESVENAIEPVLRAVDLPLNVTMQQFYEFTGIETHIYTTNLDTFTLVDVSYKTHPEWTVVDAIYSSCALPLLFRPNTINGEVYIDGASICNYPIKQCIDSGVSPDEIFGIRKTSCTTNPSTNIQDYPDDKPRYGNIVEYLIDLIYKISKTNHAEKTIHKYTMEVEDEITSVWEFYKVIKTREGRSSKIQYGVDVWRAFKLQMESSREEEEEEED
jgi:predicted acylesterase/phospholipase RssA